MDAKVDLRVQGFDTRNQGERPTCLSFALSDAHALTKGISEFLSPEYLFYHSVQRTAKKDPSEGTGVSEAMDALHEEGQPTEADCPYRPVLDSKLVPGSFSKIYRTRCECIPCDLEEVRACLDEEVPVLLGVRLTFSFYGLKPDSYILSDKDDRGVNSAHALLAVGYGELEGELHFLIRNNWGNEWGLEGHCWLGRRYLESQLVVAMKVDE